MCINFDYFISSTKDLLFEKLEINCNKSNKNAYSVFCMTYLQQNRVLQQYSSWDQPIFNEISIHFIAFKPLLKLLLFCEYDQLPSKHEKDKKKCDFFPNVYRLEIALIADDMRMIKSIRHSFWMNENKIEDF